VKLIEINRDKQLKDQPGSGHNRWHPDIPPIIEVAEGEEVLIETRDALDGQIDGTFSEADFGNLQSGLVHPLTGPIFVKGAEPGDLLEVEFLDIEVQETGFTIIKPGFGFLRDLYTRPFVVHWNIDKNCATSAQLPGVRIPGSPFMGISGVAPTHAQVQAWTHREMEVWRSGNLAQLPDPRGAIPSSDPIATHGLRTLPPRENGGNLDAKQLTKGSKLRLPVFVTGALFSTGDGHFAQGDGEVCGTAIELAATATVRFRISKGEAARHNIRAAQFSGVEYSSGPNPGVPRSFTATTGLPLRDDGGNEGENLTLACRNALINMIHLLQARGWSPEQAYVLCSVAVDLKITNAVDLPNVVVSACLPDDIFELKG
jgi:formamidase